MRCYCYDKKNKLILLIIKNFLGIILSNSDSNEIYVNKLRFKLDF